GACVGVARRSREVGGDLPLVADRRADGARVLKILVEHEDVRVIRGRGGAEISVCGDDAERTRAPRDVTDRPVRAAGAREVQARDARVVDPGVAPDYLFPRRIGIIAEAEARLERL